MQENLKEQIANKKIMEKRYSLEDLYHQSVLVRKEMDKKEGTVIEAGGPLRSHGTEASTMRPNIDWFLKI